MVNLEGSKDAREPPFELSHGVSRPHNCCLHFKMVMVSKLVGAFMRTLSFKYPVVHACPFFQIPIGSFLDLPVDQPHSQTK